MSRSFAIVGRSCALQMRRVSIAKSLQVATVIMRCNALCYIIIMTESESGGSFVTCYPVWRQTWLWNIVDAYKRTLLHPEVRRWSHTHVHAHTHACMCMCVNSLCMWVSCMCPSALLFAALLANLIELSRYQRNCHNPAVSRARIMINDLTESRILVRSCALLVTFTCWQ